MAAKNLIIFNFQIISGQQLPRPRGSMAKGDVIDPYIVIQLFGIPADCTGRKQRSNEICNRPDVDAQPVAYHSVFLHFSDCGFVAERKTKIVSNEGNCPIFEESFEFQVVLPELVLVRFVVLDDDYIGDDFIGQYTIPFDCLQPGKKSRVNIFGSPSAWRTKIDLKIIKK